MKYLCEICGKAFDSSIVCQMHIEEHNVEDLYNKVYLVSDNELFQPGGYVVLPDGYLVSGVEIGLYDDKISFNMTHWPPEVLRKKPTVDKSAINKAITQNISKIMEKCLNETAMNTIKRNKEMLKEEE